VKVFYHPLDHCDIAHNNHIHFESKFDIHKITALSGVAMKFPE